MSRDERRQDRGRGRGRASRHTGSGRRDRGPTLPMRLAKELGLPTPAIEPARARIVGRGRSTEVSGQRRTAHTAAHSQRAKALALPHGHAAPALATSAQPGVTDFDKAIARPANDQPGKRKLQDARVTDTAFEAEERLQAHLAKKLKVKKGQSLKGPEDGLDAILTGMEDVLGDLPRGSASPFGQMGDNRQSDSTPANDSDCEDDLSVSDDNAIQLQSSDLSSDADTDLGSGSSQHSDLSASMSDDDDCGSDRSAIDVAHHETASVRTVPSGKAPAHLPSAASKHAKRPHDHDADEPCYVPPAMRGRHAEPVQPEPGTSHGLETGKEHTRKENVVRRQIRSLLNRVATANLGPIAQQIAAMFSEMPRHAVIEALTSSAMQALAEGPRAVDQFASVTACLLSLVAALVPAQDLLAKWLYLLAQGLQTARGSDDSIASGNIARVLCHLYLCKATGSNVIFSLLEHLKATFSDADVTLIVNILHGVGLALRSDDAAGMKTFVLAVHSRAAELGAQGALSQRARLMLDLVVDIKNNRKRSEGAGGRTASLPPHLAKLLRESNVEAVSLHNLSWEKILTCSKKGLWWQPRADEAKPGSVVPVAAMTGRPEEEQHIVRLAASQRMNTDGRRAVFSVLMAADDYLDAAERLLRLPLKGTVERDIARVIVQCCLQEKEYNPYYALVMARVAAARRAHRVTLQNVLRDKLQELADLAPRQTLNLGRFLASVLASKAASVAVLKDVEFGTLQGKHLVFFRACVCHLLLAADSPDAVEETFQQMTFSTELQSGLHYFVRHVLAPELVKPRAGALHLSDRETDTALLRLRRAERGLKVTRQKHGKTSTRPG